MKVGSALVLCIAVVLAASAAVAQSESRYRIDGDRLIFDTDQVKGDLPASITSGDVDPILALLRKNPDISVLELNSSGGGFWAGRRLASIVMDFGLDTHVNGECASNCTVVFVAGAKRTMSRGSRIGFHQSVWLPEYTEEYYTDEAGAYGWESPWDFASWIYKDTQQEVYENLDFLLSRGVRGDFAIETLKAANDDMWYPSRKDMLSAGFLTE